MKKCKESKLKKRIKFNSLLVLIVCSALATAGFVFLFFALYAVYDVYHIDMSVDVADVSAFNTDADSIKFGRARPDGVNSRTIVVEHDYSKPLLVQFKIKGNISRFVGVPLEFYLESGMSKEVSLDAAIPKDASFGHYDGVLVVYFRRI